MRYVAAAAFLLGLLLWIRVMFFGVRREDAGGVAHRTLPFALAAFFIVGGFTLYLRARVAPVTTGWGVAVFSLATAAAAAAWIFVRRSAAIPSTDPEDDPRYRFQGHVARITERLASNGGTGRIAFDFDGRRYEFRAQWSPSAPETPTEQMAQPGAEVVIEIVEGEMAFVEPWVLVETRL